VLFLASISAHRSQNYDRSPSPWQGLQLGVLILPLSLIIGGLLIIAATVMTWKDHYATILRRPVNWVLAVLAIWLVITSVVAHDRTDALIGLANFLPYFGVFAALPELISNPVRLWRLAWLIVMGAIPVVIIGIGQMFWGWGGQVPLLTVIFPWPMAAGGVPLGRMSSVFDYTNVLASYLGVSLPMAIGVWLDGYDHGQGNGWSKRRVIHLMGIGLAIAGMVVSMVLTHSRNGWAIAMVTIVTFALYRGWHWLIALSGAGITIILVAAFGPASPLREFFRTIVPAYVWARLNDQLFPQSHDFLRTTQWQFAVHLTQQRPLTGWGLRNFTPLYEAHTHFWLGHPHNLLLMISAEAGIPAALLLFGLVGWIVAHGWLAFWQWVVSPSKHLNGSSVYFHPKSDGLILFTYLIAFLNCGLFHTLDVPLFDACVNFLGWLSLAGILGLINQQQLPKKSMEKGG